MKIDEKLLCILPKEKIEGIYTHANAGRFAIECPTRMIVDGIAEESFERIDKFVFSLDGSRYAYAATKGEHSFFVVDGQIQQQFDSIRWNTLKAGPGGKFVFAAKKGDHIFVILDDKQFGPLEAYPGDNYQRTSPIAFNSSGEKVAYAGKRNGNYALEVNGIRSKEEFSFARSFVFGKGGEVAYRARRNNAWVAVYKNEIWGPYERCCAPAISEDGSECAYLASNENASHAYINGKKIEGPYTRHGLHCLFSKSGVAYDAQVKLTGEDKSFVVINGNRGPYHEFIRGLTLSNDGCSYAYIAVEDNGEYLVLNEDSFGPYSDLVHLTVTISPDGKRVACLSSAGEDFVLINSKKGPKFDAQYGKMYWTEDGKCLRYTVVREDKLLLVEHRF